MEESGDDATRLELSAQRQSSLRARFALRAEITPAQGNDSSVSGMLEAAWERELLSRYVTQKASFAAHDADTFDSRNRIIGDQALLLRAGVSFEARPDMRVGAHLTGQYEPDGYHSLAGKLSLRWLF